MLFADGIDVIEDRILQYDPILLNLLLADKSTKHNIIWATDNYAYRGDDYSSSNEIKTSLITGENTGLIRPRVSKNEAAQNGRTRDKAEVFTPCWVCNEQNNLVDNEWFARENVFNTPEKNSWKTIKEKIIFPDDYQHSWKKYVDTKRLEVSCGEAPYIVSRYDTVTGELIPIGERVGLLDRKLRIVSENTESLGDWNFWAIRAIQSVYGYEYQGDNLLLARENILVSYIEYFENKFNENPDKAWLRKIARIISWNLWQMDGMKFVVPESCRPIESIEVNLFGEKEPDKPCPGCNNGNPLGHTGCYCRIQDWRDKSSLRFIDMIKGAKA